MSSQLCELSGHKSLRSHLQCSILPLLSHFVLCWKKTTPSFTALQLFFKLILLSGPHLPHAWCHNFWSGMGRWQDPHCQPRQMGTKTTCIQLPPGRRKHVLKTVTRVRDFTWESSCVFTWSAESGHVLLAGTLCFSASYFGIFFS